MDVTKTLTGMRDVLEQDFSENVVLNFNKLNLLGNKELPISMLKFVLKNISKIHDRDKTIPKQSRLLISTLSDYGQNHRTDLIDAEQFRACVSASFEEKDSSMGYESVGTCSARSI